MAVRALPLWQLAFCQTGEAAARPGDSCQERVCGDGLDLCLPHREQRTSAACRKAQIELRMLGGHGQGIKNKGLWGHTQTQASRDTAMSGCWSLLCLPQCTALQHLPSCCLLFVGMQRVQPVHFSWSYSSLVCYWICPFRGAVRLFADCHIHTLCPPGSTSMG